MGFSNTFLYWLPRLLLILAVLVGSNLVWLIPAIQSTRRSASVLALEIADRVRAETGNYLQGAVGALQGAAEEIAVEPDRMKVALERFLRKNVGFRSVAVVGRNGLETFRLDRFEFVPVEKLKNRAAEPNLSAALAGESNFGAVFLSPQFEPYTTLAVPVYRAGEASAVLLAELNLRALVFAVRSVAPERGTVYIADEQGFLTVHPNLTELLRRPNFIQRPIVQKVVIQGLVADGLAVDDGYRDERGEAMFAVGVPIPIAKLGLFFEQPRSQALAGITQLIAFAAITVVLGAALFVVVFANTLSLRRLNAVLRERNEEGLVSAKILVRRDRELVFTNTRLRELLGELEEVGKMLVRRDLELTRANARLMELDQIKSEFVSIAAHQLRTPLTGIRWSYQTLLDQDGGPVGSEQRRLLESGLGATLRMIELVNDLLSVARIEEGKFGIRLRKQSIMPVIEELAARYEALTKNKGVAFALEVLKGEPLPDLTFDEDKITLVIDNILDNALKYTEPGGKVALRVMLEDSRVKIEIQDSGIGIPQAQIHRVFTKFFRADNAMRLHTDGTGLGLYVAKNIIENHNGTVEARSEEGKGSVFTLTLPIV